jgi:hypothetical protein
MSKGEPLRFIYIDEAGTDVNQPFTIVTGIIVDADTQYIRVEQEIAKLVETVPEKHRTANFISHATSIYHGVDGLREEWSWEDRRQFIKTMLAIPLRLGVPICIGIVRRTTPLDPNTRLSLVDHHHMIAFSICIADADRYIMKKGHPNEIGTLVVENIPERERLLRSSFEMLKKHGRDVSGYQHTHEETMPGSIRHYEIKRIRDVPHFVQKQDSPLLWIADAAAFSYSRYLSGKSFGDELTQSIRVLPIEQFRAGNNFTASGIIEG